VYAFADAPSDAAPAEARAGKEKGKHFPMASVKFKEIVEKRIAKVKERIADRMDKRNVPADKQKEIMAEVDAGAARVRAAADQAGKDGTVTAEEAKTVRAVVKDVRKDAREKLGKGKGKKGKGKKGKADA
jgi:hypothetical protein